MSAIITIEGRKAIPVRALPFVTGWVMLPDNIASSLAYNDLAKKFSNLFAYYVSSHGYPVRLLPKDWDVVEMNIEIYSRSLETNGKISPRKYAVWRQESIKLLLPGSFVWKDEFEKAFTLFYASDSYIQLEARPGDRELNFCPLIPLESREAVTEGFLVSQEVDKPEKSSAMNRDYLPDKLVRMDQAVIPLESREAVTDGFLVSEEVDRPKKSGAMNRDYLSDKLAKMNQAAEKFWSNADRNERDTHPDNTEVAAWFEKNGFSPTLASKAATLIRPEWVPSGRKPEKY